MSITSLKTEQWGLLYCHTSKQRTWPNVLSISREKNISFQSTAWPPHLCFPLSNSSPGPYHNFPKSICTLLKVLFFFFFFFHLYTTSSCGSQLSVFHTVNSISHTCTASAMTRTNVSSASAVIHKHYVLRLPVNVWFTWELRVTTLLCVALSGPVLVTLPVFHVLIIHHHHSDSQPPALTWSPSDRWADCVRAVVMGTSHSCRRLRYKAAAVMAQLQLDEQIDWVPEKHMRRMFVRTTLNIYSFFYIMHHN